MARLRPVVADTSPLILLGRTDQLSLLRTLFGRVVVPAEVADEASRSSERPGARQVREAISQGVVVVRTPRAEPPGLRGLAAVLDKGEAAAIALAVSLRARVILMDDLAGRRVANALGLRPLGTAGVMLLAARRGLVDDFAAALACLEATGLRVSTKLRRRLLAAHH
jgi:hypothetical protein